MATIQRGNYSGEEVKQLYNNGYRERGEAGSSGSLTIALLKSENMY